MLLLANAAPKPPSCVHPCGSSVLPGSAPGVNGPAGVVPHQNEVFRATRAICTIESGTSCRPTGAASVVTEA